MNVVTQPDGTASDEWAEAVELRRIDKPKIGVGLFGSGVCRFEGTRVEEFRFRRVVTSQDEFVVPKTKVAHDLIKPSSIVA